MKNTGRKILILGIVIAIAVAGIFAFYPTIVAPPIDVPVYNLHKSSLKTNIEGFSDTENTVFNDSIYNLVVDKLILYKSEGFLTEKEIDSQTKALVQKYLPIFTKLSHAKFRAPTWQESDHKAMLNRIAHLRTLKIDYGKTSAVAESFESNSLVSFESDLRRIEQIISDYKEAKKIATYSTFYSVSDANTKIQNAEKYRKMDPLSNCRDLTNKLAAVKSNIGDSHYQYLESKVEELSSFTNRLEDDFYMLMSFVASEIEEYENIRFKYGSDAKTTNELKEQASDIYRKAKEFYTRKNITVITNNQWMSIISPSVMHKAYQSSSNYNKDNSEAIMYFTIKGYDTFTFYVRSDGESDCDYVMVGKDSRPTTSSNYTTTKGSPSSGTNLYNYKSVTFDNLNKSLTYTIYVVYHKDGSVNKGTDRGYVLIPYANN